MPLKKVKVGSNMYQGWITHTHSLLGGECEHKCDYCLNGETPILMSSGCQKLLKDIKVGDEIVGLIKGDKYIYYTKTYVLKKWATIKNTIVVKLENGANVECSANHKWKTTRGWLYTKKEDKKRRNIGLASRINCIANPTKIYNDSFNYQCGYLCGSIKGDGHLALHKYYGRGRLEKHYQFRLACKDKEIVETTRYFLKNVLEVCCQEFKFPMKNRQDKKWIGQLAIRTSSQGSYEKILKLVQKTDLKNYDWTRGFLAGAFDAEGSFGRVIRISNQNENYLSVIKNSLNKLGFKFVQEEYPNNDCKTIRIVGGLSEFVRFFLVVNPKIKRKFNVFGIQVKKSVKVSSIISTNKTKKLYDITTGTGNFIANGLISHNCYVDNPRFGRAERYKGQLRLIEREFDTNYGSNKTIFIEHMNDLFASDVPRDFIIKILEHCKEWPDNTYVFQTKNPVRFLDVFFHFPEKSIFGITLETNRDTSNISKAPRPEDRMLVMKKLNARKFVTIEPVLDFDVDILANWIAQIRPEFLNLGADSKDHNLPEPTVEKIMALVAKLKEYGIELREKHNLQRLTQNEK